MCGMFWYTAEKQILSLVSVHSETVVLKLMEKLLNCSHALYVDNFYTSVPLAEALLN